MSADRAAIYRMECSMEYRPKLRMISWLAGKVSQGKNEKFRKNKTLTILESYRALAINFPSNLKRFLTFVNWLLLVDLPSGSGNRPDGLKINWFSAAASRLFSTSSTSLEDAASLLDIWLCSKLIASTCETFSPRQISRLAFCSSLETMA